MLIFFFLLVTVTLGALAWSGFELFREQEDPLTRRLEQLRAHAMATSTNVPRRRARGLSGNTLYLISLAPGGEGWLRSAEEELAQAGVRQNQALAVYALFHLAFLLCLLAGALFLERNQSFSSRFAASMAALVLGWLLPQQVLHHLVKRYRRKLQDALPDTVDLLGIVLGTGLALDQAMLRVSQELEYIYPELAAEFATVVMQVRAGQERAKAFDQLVKRTGVEDIKSLAAMVVQSERFGTSLSQALHVYSDSLRARRRVRAESAVAKAGIKMLFPVVLFILPALFVIVLVPALLSVLHSLQQGFGPQP
jgi:tight adherence protein C